jgi:type IVB pilus formation R64 PilN family outer membrane protein
MGAVNLRRRCILAILLLLPGLASCVAPPNHIGAFLRATGTHARALLHHTEATVAPVLLTVRQGVWLGAQPTRRRPIRPLWLDTRITLVARGSATTLLSEAAHLAGRRLRFEDLGAPSNPKSSARTFCPGVDAIAYTGSLKHFLDRLTARCRIWWRVRGSTLVVFRLRTRTFVVDVPPGVTRSNEVLGSEGGLGDNAGTASTYGTGSGSVTEQQEQGRTQFADALDPWPSLRRHLAALLTRSGRVILDETAGTITVTDTPPALHRIARYLRTMDHILARQVAVVVRVYSVRLRRRSRFAAAADIVYKSLGAGVSGALTTSGVTGGSGLKAAVLSGRGPWSGSRLVLTALNHLGQAALITTGSGVVMDDEPLPVDNTRTLTYLAQVSSFTSANVGSTTAVSPGTVTYGFALTAIPHILRHRRIELSVFLSLSSLDALAALKSGGETIEGPDLSSRDLASTVIVPSGATLVLAGYQKLDADRRQTGGLGDWSTRASRTRSLIVVTVQARLLDGGRP